MLSLFSFIGAHIMLFVSLIKGVTVSSGVMDHFDSSRYARRRRRRDLGKSWLITILLYALTVYAAYHLYD